MPDWLMFTWGFSLGALVMFFVWAFIIWPIKDKKEGKMPVSREMTPKELVQLNNDKDFCHKIMNGWAADIGVRLYEMPAVVATFANLAEGPVPCLPIYRAGWYATKAALSAGDGDTPCPKPSVAL